MRRWWAAVERHRRHQAAARCRLLQLPDPVHRNRRRGARRRGGDTLSARRRSRRGGVAAPQPLRHGARLPRDGQRQHLRAGADREQTGVEAIDAIAAVDGVDGIFVGPTDLAAAFGHLGNPGHPDVQKAIRHVFDRAKAQASPAASWRRSRPMPGATWSGARPSSPSAATSDSSAAPRRHCATKFPGGGPSVQALRCAGSRNRHHRRDQRRPSNRKSLQPTQDRIR